MGRRSVGGGHCQLVVMEGLEKASGAPHQGATTQKQWEGSEANLPLQVGLLYDMWLQL
jgi:hypothetical protein